MFGTWKTTYKFKLRDRNIMVEATTWRELDEIEQGQLERLIELYISILKSFNDLDLQKIIVYPADRSDRAKQLFP